MLPWGLRGLVHKVHQTKCEEKEEKYLKSLPNCVHITTAVFTLSLLLHINSLKLVEKDKQNNHVFRREREKNPSTAAKWHLLKCHMYQKSRTHEGFHCIIPDWAKNSLYSTFIFKINPTRMLYYSWLVRYVSTCKAFEPEEHIQAWLCFGSATLL